MRKFKLFLACALMLFFGVSAWADTPAAAGTTLFSEDFSSYAANAVPSGSVTTGTGRVVYGDANVTYSCTDGGSTTKIYNEATGGGTAPEILVSKTNGTFVITGIPSGSAQEITVSWTQNKQNLSVAPTGTGYTGSYSGKPSNVGPVSFDITVADGADATFTLTFTGSGSSNVRVDDILVTVKTAGEGAGTPKCATPTFTPAAGSYEGTQNVTISSTAGATIYYTTDGSTPNTGSSVYSTPIAVSASQTIKAYATLTSYDDSDVAEAAYTITEGPDVTLDLIDGNWGFPTSSGTSVLTEYTNSVTGYAVSCYAQTEYKVNGSNYFIIGKSGSYILLPEFANPVEKIVVVGNSSGSGSVVFNIFDGDDAASTAVTGCTADATFNIDNPEANKQYKLKVTSTHNLQLKKIKIFFGATPAVAKPTISGDENFVTSTTVTLDCSTTGADIYYTTDGSDPKSGTIGTSFSLTETATVRAIAKLGSDWSDEATSKTFTKVSALSTMAEVQAAATSSETEINVAITNWVVTAVSGSQVWIAAPDNLKGILLYKSSNGFAAGNKLNGVVVGTKIKLYNDYPELTSLVAGDVTVTTADAITPRTTTIADLTSGHPAEQGTIVKLENLTYTAASTSFSDGANTIQIDTKLYSPALVDGATYTITGVVEYLASSVIKIMPRSADDVEGGASLPEVTGLAALKAEATGVSYLLTLENAVVTLVDGSNAFIEDATAGALIYKSGHGFSAGDKLNGQYEVTTTTYQGKFEMTAITAQAGATTTPGAEIPVTTLTIAQLNANFAANESKRIKIVGVNVTDAVETGDATARTGEISDGANAIALYAGKSGVTAALNDNIDVIGYPTFHNTDEQLAVWAQADITVNEKEDPEISYSPASVNLTVGDALSAPTFNNPHTLSPITYSTDNDAVATVDEYGAIALAGGTGTAVITASYAGDATYNAGNATFTINVSAADSRKNAVGPAEFTTTSGFLTPNDILFISYKGGASTAPGNYNSGIRLYQISGTNTYGGYVTLIAKKGCKIDEVEITTTNKYATTVGYYVNADDAAIQGSADVAKSGTYNTATGLNADSVRILNLGTGSNGRLEIASITVYYTGDAASVDHYELGGTYQTDFEIDDAFNHDGLSVYMAYDAGGTEKLDITAGCTFSSPDMTVAGTPTVEISFGTTVITSYDITVAASTLLDPELSYDPTSVTLTQGDALSAPTLNNPHTLDLTFNSNKTAVATVDEFGVITLAGGTGTATITASFAGDATYQAGNATFTITVNEPEEDLTGTWEFATSVAAGDRIIIASIADAGAVTTMGTQNGNNRSGVASTVAGTELTPAAGTKSVTLVDAGEGKFALQLNNGSYLYAASNTNNYLKETAAYADNENAKWTIAFDGEGVATITAQGTNSHNVMRYNPNSGSPLFNCYTSSSTTGTLVTVYKKDVPAPAYEEVRTGLTAGNYYTVCYDKTMTSVTGASLWHFVGKDVNFAYIEEVSAPFPAGTPYILYAEAATVTAEVEGDATLTAGSNGAIHGTFSAMDQAALDAAATAAGHNLYLVIGNQLRQATGDALTVGNSLPANRAYVILDEIPGGAPAPGKKVRSMPLQAQVTTGMDELNAGEKPVKVMINGQLFILRGEKLFDATGKLVK